MADSASRIAAPPASITCLSAHARHVPAAERERLAVALRAAREAGGVVIETCHRVEGYFTGEGDPELNAPTGTQVLRGTAAIRHAVTVAVGRDSVVIGEDQVLHQIREALDRARAAGGPEPVLERLFACALRAGRQARTWGRGTERSLATVAVAALERQTGSLRGRPVLIVGAGRMGRLAARAAVKSGAMVTIANRSPGRAIALAREVGGSAAPFDPEDGIRDAAGLIVALGGPWSIGRAASAALAMGSAPVVDLSVPGAIAADLAANLGPRLITVDDLANGEVDEPDARHVRRLDVLIDGATSDFVTWLDGHDRRAAAAALAERADRAREAELEVLWRQLPELDPTSREAIEAMTRHLAQRLLREPLERLGQDADGRTERAVREVFAL